MRIFLGITVLVLIEGCLGVVQYGDDFDDLQDSHSQEIVESVVGMQWPPTSEATPPGGPGPGAPPQWPPVTEGPGGNPPDNGNPGNPGQPPQWPPVTEGPGNPGPTQPPTNPEWPPLQPPQDGSTQGPPQWPPILPPTQGPPQGPGIPQHPTLAPQPWDHAWDH